MDVTRKPIGELRRPTREPVLILAHADGYIEAFAEKHIDIKIVSAPHIRTANGERIVDDYVDLILSQKFADVFYPGKMRANAIIRNMLPSDFARRDIASQVIKILDRFVRGRPKRQQNRRAPIHSAIDRATKRAVAHRRKARRRAAR